MQGSIDKEISEKCADIEESKDQSHAFLKFSDDIKEIFAEGAKWARDFDPWYYPQDGHFPELERDISVIKSSRRVLAFIDLEDEPKIIYYIFDKYEEEYRWIDDNVDPYPPYAVKSWMHIPTTNK